MSNIQTDPVIHVLFAEALSFATSNNYTTTSRIASVTR
jgi:hypothetical protein